MKDEIREIAEGAVVGFTKAPLDSDLESAIVIGVKGMEDLEGVSRKISLYLTTKGHFAEAVDPKEEGIDIKRFATSASLGAIGKNSLVITPEFGPRVRFAVILTDALIEVDEPSEFNFCDGCSACIEACPAGAISESGYDVSLCEHSKGNVCVICMEACPVGEDE
jgi:ferredoxin